MCLGDSKSAFVSTTASQYEVLQQSYCTPSAIVCHVPDFEDLGVPSGPASRAAEVETVAGNAP